MGSVTACAALLEEDHWHEFMLGEIQLKPLEPGEILVQIEASGVCHTDLALKQMVERPCVLGHEGTGIVVAVGAGVDDLAINDCVILAYASCGGCSSCNSGRLNLCDHNFELSFSGYRATGGTSATRHGEPVRASVFQQSSFSTHVIAQARNAVRVDSSLSPAVRATLTCSVFTGAGVVARQLALGPGDSILIFGAGVVGLSAVMAARVLGAKAVVVDPIRERRLLASELGAAETIDSCGSDVLGVIKQVFPAGAAAILDTSGAQVAWDQAIANLAMGGVFAFVTVPQPMESASLPAFELIKRGAAATAVIQGGAKPAEFIPQLIDWYRAGDFPVEKFICTYPFAEINRAFKDMSEHRVIKPVLLMENSGEIS